MIKLELLPAPSKLTKELVAKLTEKYLSDEMPVWNKKFIRDSVASLSSNKCCYSEIKIGTESKYMEIDHFHPKKHYPQEVLKWGNLLPSCKKSNTTKGDLDTKKHPIVNPFIDDPKDHLYIQNFRFYPKTEMGRRTIDFTALNDREHFVYSRSKISFKVIEILEDIELELQNYERSTDETGLKRVRIVNKYKSLLSEASRKNEYAASLSTTIITENSNNIITSTLKTMGYWDKELDRLIEEIKYCALLYD